MPNAALAAYLVTFHDLPDTHWPQVEQQLLISGAARCLFTVADTKIHAQLYYTSRPHRQLELLAGWQQFSEDFANYVHSEPIAAAVAAPIKQLPALIVQLSGAVESSNIALYRDAALAMIESINVELKTDDDFANAESMVKFCDAAEKELDTVKRQAIAQTATIDELFRSVDLLKELMRSKRLMLDKLVKARKESIKIEVMRDAQDKLRKHINGLNNRLVSVLSVQMPFVPEDFAGVMKGKRTITSLQDAVDGELAQSKIRANAIADKIEINLAIFANLSAPTFLFSDLSSLMMKAPDDFRAIITNQLGVTLTLMPLDRYLLGRCFPIG